MQLEYETIDNKELAENIRSRYMTGRTLSYEHVSLLKVEEWNKDLTVINETINTPNKSMKGEKGETDSEKFANPNITNVSITIEGVPNMVYSEGLPKERIYEEAQRLFENDMKKREMSKRKFYKDKYALWLDLRSTYSKNISNEGKRLVKTQSGVLLRINKTATTKDLSCYIFVLSDALINFSDGKLISVDKT